MMHNIKLPSDLTLARLLAAKAGQFGNRKAALRVKSHGIWQETSWQKYFEKVREFSLGISMTGLLQGETLAIIGRNRPSSLYAIIGAQVSGGIPVCIHHESTSEEIASYIRKFDLKYILAEDQEQVDKLLENPEAGMLQKIIYCNPRGLKGYPDQRLVHLDQLLSTGRETHEKNTHCFDEMMAAGASTDIALICTTSGSTGEPRGALLSHKNILTSATNLISQTSISENHETVSFLPLSWIGELMISLASAMLAGFTVNFPESTETAWEDLREIGPHLIFAPPEIWGKIASSVQVRMMESTPFKKFMFKMFMPLAESCAETALCGKSTGLVSRMMYGVAYIALIRALRDRLGLSRVITAITGGSPLGRDAFKFFHSIGVNLKQIYGLTEMSGAAAMHRDSDIRVESVGMPLPGVEVKISSEGEILLKGDGIFQGYLNDQEDSSAVEDGWLHTGDAGRVDPDGHLIVTDRCDSIITLADGSRVAPQFIESSIKFSPYIKESIVTGRGKDYLSALICIDGKVVGKWAGDNKLSYGTYSDLASKPEVYDLINLELTRLMKSMPENCRVKRFTILYKDLDPDDGEMTRIGKVRRNIVENRFSELIDALYKGDEAMKIDKSIELGDGKSARVQSTVIFKNLA